MTSIVRLSLRNVRLVVLLLVAVLGAGYAAFRVLNVEAYPDPVPPQVEIVTQATGIASEEIERDFTAPIEASLAGVPNVAGVHSISQFGMSDVHVQFTYAFSYQEAVQRVQNALAQLPPLPYGAVPGISPESPTGEIYRFQVVGPPGYPVSDLKTLMNWTLVRRFSAVPGVASVAGWGGETKTYEASVDPRRMAAAGVSLPQILTALGNADADVGGQTIDVGETAVAVRGVGLIRTLDDLRATLVAPPVAAGGAPVLLGDVADVKVGHLPRLGVAGRDDENDVVLGIVLMGRGERTGDALRGVEAEVARVNAGGVLPPGVRLRTIYDRADLVRVTTETVLHNLLVGVALIFLIQWAFLGDLRSAVVVASTIPFAFAFAIVVLTLTGESANLLSIGAVDFGLVVDATVIVVENVFRRLAHAPRGTRGDARLAIVGRAGDEVTRAILFAALIIVATFIPLFTLGGVEGRIFGPMARTYAYAIVGGLIAAFTVSPVLAATLLRGDVSERDTPFVRALRRAYRPALAWTLRRPGATLGLTGALLAATLLAARALGTEFLPHLEEGNFWVRATLPASISLEASAASVDRMRRVMRAFPEVVDVTSQHGRPDDGSDVGGPYNNEFFVPLKPRDRWPAGIDKATLADRMSRALTDRFPGVAFGFSQNIEDNVEEAASGVKGENAVKVFGADLATDDAVASRVVAAMARVRGIVDLAAFHSVRQPTLDVVVDRRRAARYGLAPGDVTGLVQTAVGGQAASGNLYEEGGDRNFPIVVRLAPRYRSTVEEIKALAVPAPAPGGGAPVPVPLGAVADVRYAVSPSQIYRERYERYVPVKYGVRDRDLGGAVLDARARVAAEVRLPPGVRLEWVGELAEYDAAIARLGVVVPVSLLLVAVLLYLNFGNLREAALAAAVLPPTVAGGVLALLACGVPFSVSAAIGFMALFGIAIMEGLIVVSTVGQELREGAALETAVRDACETRLRPVLMTCCAAGFGLLPAAISDGIGAQVQKPLAVVVVGGSLFAPLLILLALPALLRVFGPRPPRSPAPLDADLDAATGVST